MIFQIFLLITIFGGIALFTYVTSKLVNKFATPSLKAFNKTILTYVAGTFLIIFIAAITYTVLTKEQRYQKTGLVKAFDVIWYLENYVHDYVSIQPEIFKSANIDQPWAKFNELPAQLCLEYAALAADILKGEKIDPVRYSQFKKLYLDWTAKNQDQLLAQQEDLTKPTERQKNQDNSDNSNSILTILKNFLLFLFVLVVFFYKDVKKFNYTQKKLLLGLLIFIFMLTNFFKKEDIPYFVLLVVVDSVWIGLAMLFFKNHLKKLFQVCRLHKPTKGDIFSLAIDISFAVNLIYFLGKKVFLILKLQLISP